MDKFYFIMVIGKDNEKGFIVENLNDKEYGFSVTVGGFPADIVMKFLSYQAAQSFMREKNIECNGMRAYIYDNTDISRVAPESSFELSNTMYYIENAKGEILYYDGTTGGFYFRKGTVGFPVWHEKSDASKIIKQYGIKEEVFIKEINPKS